MQKFVITGGRPLSGTVRIAGAKNAVLKMMAAAALTDEPVSLRNVPKISDVAILREVMTDIGFDVTRSNGDALELRAVEATWPFVPLEAAREDAGQLHPARADAGPLRPRHPAEPRRRSDRPAAGRLPRHGHGAARRDDRVPQRLLLRRPRRRTDCAARTIEFPIVTVMGTENALLAATLARGTTVIDNAALEPEVDDLIAMLRGMGARIERTAERRIEVEGVERRWAASSIASSATASRPRPSRSPPPSRAGQ